MNPQQLINNLIHDDNNVTYIAIYKYTDTGEFGCRIHFFQRPTIWGFGPSISAAQLDALRQYNLQHP